LHAVYGGVVPEIASRAHVDAVDRMVDTALAEASLTLQDIDIIAVTYGPGLVGALLTGVSCAKGLAYALDKPLIPVNHIEGHICANYLTHSDLKPPFVCLVVSGGHSHIVQVIDYGQYHVLGRTADDAAGEAFDKAARVLGLPYPGGPLLDLLAEEGSPDALPLPKPRVEGPYDFSFSGLKTAFINALRKIEHEGRTPAKADMAASFRYAVVSSLTGKALLAAVQTHAPALAIAGGVACNRLLRCMLTEACQRHNMPLYMPAPALCADNAAMIGSAAYYRIFNYPADLTLNAAPDLTI
jgi:N6-L-threonylcarbamoyladenine synthase